MKKLYVVNKLDNAATNTKFLESCESSEPCEKGNKNGTKQLLGLIGSAFLFVGLFAPIVSITIIGRNINMNYNYFQYCKDDGTIVLFLAAVSLLLVLLKKFKGLWFMGLISMTILVSDFINLQRASVQIQWGWALLIVGAVLVIASAAIKE